MRIVHCSYQFLHFFLAADMTKLVNADGIDATTDSNMNFCVMPPLGVYSQYMFMFLICPEQGAVHMSAGRNYSVRSFRKVLLYHSSFQRPLIARPDDLNMADPASDSSNCSGGADASFFSCYPSFGSVPECVVGTTLSRGREVANEYCQRGCLAEAIQYQPCSSTDLKCLCAHSQDVKTRAIPCGQEQCTADEMQGLFYPFPSRILANIQVESSDDKLLRRLL